MKSTAELRKELKEAEEREREEAKRLAESVQPVYSWTLTPNEKGRAWEKVRDPAVKILRLEADLLNKKEIQEVGRAMPLEGGMDYYFNEATGRIICRVSGGSVWVTDSSWSLGKMTAEDINASADKCYAALEKFIIENPEGGDVTEIIKTHREEVSGR